jgi:hypothetical protein
MSADDRRHDQEEHHDQAVGGDQHVPQVELLVEIGVGDAEQVGELVQILDARVSQFEAHHARDGAADHAGGDREDQVEGADVLVVGGHEPAREEARLVVVIGVSVPIMVGLEMVGGGSHRVRTLF